jgi:hypothetical protein
MKLVINALPIIKITKIFWLFFYNFIGIILYFMYKCYIILFVQHYFCYIMKPYEKNTTLHNPLYHHFWFHTPNLRS